MISPELQNSEKPPLAFTFQCLLGVVETSVVIHATVYSESTSQQMDMLFFFQPFKTYLKMNCRFCAEANFFTIQSGLSPLKQLLQTVVFADKRDVALEKFAYNI